MDPNESINQDVNICKDIYDCDIELKLEEELLLPDVKQENLSSSFLTISDSLNSIAFSLNEKSKVQPANETFQSSLYGKHFGEKSFPCSKCDTCFVRKTDLKIHMRTHTGKNPFQCITCDKCFDTKSHLVRHQRTHTGDKPYQCNKCDKFFGYQDNLLKHQRTHTENKPFCDIVRNQCSQCHKYFSRKNYLARHQRKHTGESQHQCSECGLDFAHLYVLLKHQKTHTEIKPFHGIVRHQCSHCHRCFARQCDLIKHQRTHTDEKPYQCSQCDKFFACQDDLFQHQRTHKEKSASRDDDGRSDTHDTDINAIESDENVNSNIDAIDSALVTTNTSLYKTPSKIDLFLSRVNSNAKYEDIKRVSNLGSKLKSFKLSVDVCDEVKVMNQSIWPTDVKIQKWTTGLTTFSETPF